jgi:DNA-binding helix-hairpin-helix protein with protein kinase domain
MMPSEPEHEPRRVVDETGVEFVLGQEIAKGGQGTVFRVEGHPGYAIKLLSRLGDLDRIAAVRRLPLDGLPVAAPLTLIRTGGTGYLMPLASDMRPIKEPYLPREFGPRETNKIWYRQTGGLRRRLAIAANVARGIAALHERGLAYVDLNPGNVMVSDDLNRTETWLIDTDNLTSRSRPNSNILGFQGYLAPERRRRNAPPSTLADTYILAIHVFRLLVLRHPLEGVAADDLDGHEARERMDRGDLAYVGDPRDLSNQLPPRSFPAGLFPLVMSGRMRGLAERTFGEGRLEPAKRPGCARWRDVLFNALDNVIDCPDNCGWTYFRLLNSCPNCGADTQGAAIITVYSAADEQPLAARDSLVASASLATAILPRHVWGRYDQADPVVTFRPVRGGFEIEVHDEARVTDSTGRAVSRIPRPSGTQGYRVRLDVPGRPTRLLAVRSVLPA